MEIVINQWVLFGLYVLPTTIILGIGKAYINEIKKHKEEKDKTNKAIMEGLRSQLKTSIMDKYYHFRPLGYIYTDSMECVEDMYQSYHALGGNGFITKKVEILRELPNVDLTKEKENE